MDGIKGFVNAGGAISSIWQSLILTSIFLEIMPVGIQGISLPDIPEYFYPASLSILSFKIDELPMMISLIQRKYQKFTHYVRLKQANISGKSVVKASEGKHGEPATPRF